MARAGAVLVATLQMIDGRIRPGVSTGELDQAAERFIRSRGGAPTFKGYRGFPGSICASPNAMVVHGIPGPYRLKRGDIVSIDVGVTLDGWVADAARTFPVEEVSPQAQNLLGATWNRDNVIVLAPVNRTVLHKVSAAGGTPEPITTLKVDRRENSHRSPQFPPSDGHRRINANPPRPRGRRANGWRS